MSWLSALLAYTRRPQGFLDHAVPQIFYHLHAFTQSDSDFHAKALKLGKNMPFTKSRTFLNDFTKSRTFFDVFTHQARKSFHAFTHKKMCFHEFTQEKKAFHAITQTYGGASPKISSTYSRIPPTKKQQTKVISP